ncbi:MAG: hypothetical protein EXX96DRAFT_604411, partial [Benjaminiella poitrasii]
MVYKATVLLTLATCASTVLALSIPRYDTYGNLVSRNSFVTPLLDKRDSWVCSDDSDASHMLTHFSGVFFGDFDTDGGKDILGPLAVEGNFKASGYYVNANLDVDCSDDSIDSFGLVVGGSVDASDIRIRGNADVPNGSSGLQETISSCKIAQGSSNFDFDQAKNNAIKASKVLASMEPTLQLDSNGKLTSIGSSKDGFNVLTLNTCNGGNCNLFPGEMSDGSAFLEGKGNWNGAQGMSWPTDGTLVINVPVSEGETFTIAGNNPTMGMDPCITIFNFYPSDSNGKYTSGSITVERNTGGNFGGLTLAPEASIVDSSTGAFAGTIIGGDYSWDGSGVEIHTYATAGGSCTTFGGCLPIADNNPPAPPISSTTTTKSATKSSTTTTKKMTTTTGKHSTTTSGTSSTESATTTTTGK